VNPTATKEITISQQKEILELTATANMALERMGLEGRLVSHGMRSMASTFSMNTTTEMPN